MKYILQVRFDGATAAIEGLSAEEQQSVFAEFEAIPHAPGVLDGNQAAIDLAARIPVARLGGNVEIRPVVAR